MQKNTVKEFIIHGKLDYVCKMDDRRVIVERSPIPPQNDFLWCNLDKVFEKHKDRVTFELIGNKEYPLTPNDVYEEMKKKNPALISLKRAFQCETY